MSSTHHRPRRSNTSEYVPVESRTSPPEKSGSYGCGSSGQPSKGDLDKPSSSGPDVEGKGVLPYASELFGVYQPLLGWKSSLSSERLGVALANRTIAESKALQEFRDPDVQTPRLAARKFVNRTGTKIGEEVAKHLNSLAGGTEAQGIRQGIREDQQPDVVSFLKKQRDSQFFKLTKGMLKRLDDEDEPRAPGALRKEASMAAILHDLALHEPRALQQMFAPALSRLGRIRAGIKLFKDDSPSTKAFLSPIGILHLFKEYFFQLGTFLGEPVGHVWLSPGSSLELVEIQTRRQVVERTIQESVETTNKSEFDKTEKDELSDAVKSENSNDTKLGATVSGGGGMGVWHASASATFSVDNARKQAQEQTHTKMRQQSSKLSSEIKQNYKTTFRTLTETSDTSSRRYVLQNTTPNLVSYELSRKMRKVAVQVQDLGRRLCWQVYVDNPGDPLGVGEFMYTTDSAFDTSVKRPDHQAYPANIEKAFSTSFPYIQTLNGDDDTEDTYTASPNNPEIGVFKSDSGGQNQIKFKNVFQCPPTPAGFTFSGVSAIDVHGASVQWNPNVAIDAVKQQFTLILTSANFNGQRQIPFDVILVYEPTQALKDEVDKANEAAKKEYSDAVAAENETKFFDTLRARLKLVGQVRTRSQTDLRDEEKNLIYRNVISRLYGKEDGWDNEDYHIAAEIIRYFFDVDSMLYFVSPDWWKPRTSNISPIQDTEQPTVLAQQTLNDRVSLQGSNARGITRLAHANRWRRSSQCLPESPWVKAVLPIRPGLEKQAIEYMKREEVAYIDGLQDKPAGFGGKSVEEVLIGVAEEIGAEYAGSRDPLPTGVGQAAALPEEMVYSHGYDPLEGGTKFDKAAYKVFSEWMEILPTDQVVATEYQPNVDAGTLPGH